MKKVLHSITIEGAIVKYRNFSGKAGQYNPEGIRNFCVLLEPEIAEELRKDGWNVRKLIPKDPEDTEIQAYLQVKVSYEKFPPVVVLLTSKGQSEIGENNINILDFAEIDTVDLIINPYNWEMNGKKGVKAYLKKMYVKLVEDKLEAKYKNVPDSAVPPDDSGAPWN